MHSSRSEEIHCKMKRSVLEVCSCSSASCHLEDSGTYSSNSTEFDLWICYTASKQAVIWTQLWMIVSCVGTSSRPLVSYLHVIWKCHAPIYPHISICFCFLFCFLMKHTLKSNVQIKFKSSSTSEVDLAGTCLLFITPISFSSAQDVEDITWSAGKIKSSWMEMG